MGLNPRGRGRGRGGKGIFPNKGRRGGGMMGQGPMFRPGPPGMFCPPPMGFPPEPPFGAPFFPGPSNFNFAPPRPGFGKFPRKNFKRKVPQKNNEAPLIEIDLTKPWVTEEIRSEETKKQEYLEVWRKSKDDEDWSKYKSQKQIVKALYDKAKEEYATSHPEEACLWQNKVQTRRYYCDTCDKSFKTDDDLILHEADHETCGREGCEFTAHPKIIAKHVKMQHDSGLFKRIGKLYSEEEIFKWIEERKKRYPSRKVIEEKKALEQEKLKRGEKIKEDASKFNKSFRNKKKNCKNNSENTAGKCERNRRTKKRKTNKSLQHLQNNNVESSLRRGVMPFTGIMNSSEVQEIEDAQEDDFEISDDEWISGETGFCTAPILNSSLKLLASIYDSEIEKENEFEQMSDDGNDTPDEVKTVCVKNEILDSNIQDINVSKKRRKKQKHFRHAKSTKNHHKTPIKNDFECRKLTLLEKLLRKEIIHERNVILQCVNYVVKNNFFSDVKDQIKFL